MSYPEPTEVAPWYLRNITQALELNETTGQVFVRTNAAGNVTIGNITVGNVGITSFGNIPITGNTLPVSGTVAISTLTGNVTVVQGTNPWTVTGNVIASVTGNVNASVTGNVNASVTGNVGASIIGNVNVTQGTNPWTVTGNVTTIPSGTTNVALGGNNLDAFGRLRISDPYTLFDSALNGERRNDFSSATAGAGNVTFDYNANVRQLNVTNAAGDEVIRESMYTFPYQPGKSLLTMNSFVMSPAKTNLRQRVGYFTTNNGVYFEQTGTTKCLFAQSKHRYWL